MALAGEVYQSEDGTVSTVLGDQYDPEYEPSASEIEEYAQFLGIDTAKERELLWISREGLKAPLPPEWKPCKTDKDEVYYFNFDTGDSIWDHPLDSVYKSKVEEEKEKLKAGNYTPPPGAHSGTAGTGHNAIEGENISKKKKKKIAGDTGDFPKLLRKGAAGDCGLDTQKASPDGIGSLGYVSEIKPLGKLGELGPLQDRNKPDISMLVSDAKYATFLNKGKQRDSASVLKDANITAEQRIRARLEQEYDSRKAREEAKGDQLARDVEEEFDRKIQNLERDADMKLEEEVESASSTIDRRLKKELLTLEEDLDRQEEILKRRAKQERNKIHDLEIQINMTSDGKDSNTEIEVATINRDVQEEINQKRAELYSEWQSEKNSVELSTQTDVQAYMKTCEEELTAENAKLLVLWTNNYNESDDKQREEIKTLKKDLEKQKAVKSEMFIKYQQESEKVKEEAFRAVEKTNEDVLIALKKNITRKVEETCEVSKKRLSTLSNAHARSKEKLRADHDIKVAKYEKKRQCQESSMDDTIAEHTETLIKNQHDYEFKMEHALQEFVEKFETDTVKEVRTLTRELSDSLIVEDMSKQKDLVKEIEQARNNSIEEIEEALKVLKTRQHEELEILQEEMSRVERNHSKAVRDLYSSTISTSITKLEDKKKMWLKDNPEPSFNKIPVVQCNTTVSSLSNLNELTHRLDADTEEATRAAKEDVKKRLLELQKTVRDEVDDHIIECRSRASGEMEKRLIKYRADALEDAIEKVTRKYQERECQQKQQIQLSSSSSNTASVRALKKLDKNMNARKVGNKSVRKDDPSRSIKRILRRQRLRSEMEEKHRLECSKIEFEISRKIGLEREKLEKRLQDLAAKLSKEVAALTSDISPRSSKHVDHHVTPLQNSSLISHGSSPNIPPNCDFSKTQLPIQSDYGSAHYNSSGSKRHYAKNQHHELSCHFNMSNRNTPVRTLVLREIEADITPISEAGVRSSSPYYQGPTSFGERIARAWNLVNSHKKKLKTRRQEMEGSRADWRIDMEAAKLAKDTSTIALLRKVHTSMEIAAHQLNNETRELQSTIKYLKEQEAAEANRRAFTPTCHSTTARRNVTLHQNYTHQVPSLMSPYNRHHYSHVDPQQNLVEVLQTVLEKANNMEKRFVELEREQTELWRSSKYNSGSNVNGVRISPHDPFRPSALSYHKKKRGKHSTTKRGSSRAPQVSPSNYNHTLSLKNQRKSRGTHIEDKSNDGNVLGIYKWGNWLTKGGASAELIPPYSTVHVSTEFTGCSGDARERLGKTGQIEKCSSPNLNVVNAWLKDINNH